MQAQHETTAAETEVRSMWEFASVCQFFRSCRSIMSIPNFGPSQLESALNSSHDLDDARSLLPALHKKLLLAIHGSESNSKSSKQDWRRQVKTILDEMVDEYDDLWEDRHPLEDDVDYADLSARDRILVLYAVCLHALETSSEIQEFCQTSAESWRGSPFGVDAEGNEYYRFSDDCWIFRQAPAEIPKGRKKKQQPQCGVWGVACSSLPGLRELVDDLKQSRNTQQRRLVSFIEKNILPGIEAAEQAKERAQLKRDRVMYAPRRQSSRVARKMAETEKLEEERRRIEEAEIAEREERERQLAEERRIAAEHAREIRAKRREEALAQEAANRISRSERYLQRKSVEDEFETQQISETDSAPEENMANDDAGDSAMDTSDDIEASPAPAAVVEPSALRPQFQSPPPPMAPSATSQGQQSATTLSSTKAHLFGRHATTTMQTTTHVERAPSDAAVSELQLQVPPVPLSSESRAAAAIEKETEKETAMEIERETEDHSPSSPIAESPSPSPAPATSFSECVRSPGDASSQVLSAVTIPRTVAPSIASSLASQITVDSQNSKFSMTSASGPVQHRSHPALTSSGNPNPHSVHSSFSSTPTASGSTSTLLSPLHTSSMPPVARDSIRAEALNISSAAISAELPSETSTVKELTTVSADATSTAPPLQSEAAGEVSDVLSAPIKPETVASPNFKAPSGGEAEESSTAHVSEGL